MLSIHFLKKGKARGGGKKKDIKYKPKNTILFTCFLIHINNGYRLSIQIIQVMTSGLSRKGPAV